MFLGSRYRLLNAPLSTGSFGSVFVAEDERMPRRVAVKVLHPQHAENPTVRARFRRELEAACRVSHENVVSVFDIGEDPNLGLYYVMELVRGTPLKDYLNGDALPWPFVLRVAEQLTRALHAIHSADIVHRDLKPQNIMLVERSSLDELVKVLDFGIASLKSESGEDQGDVELTGARMVLGTPPYMSPEQTYMRSDRDRLGLTIDARSDIYSLGVILYEMAAGRRPFNGDAHDIVVAHRLTKPMPLERMVGVSVPEPFAELVMSCLAKNPRDRPQNAKVFLQALKVCEAAPVRTWNGGVRRDPQDTPTEMDMNALPMSVGLPASTSSQPSIIIADDHAAPEPPTGRMMWAPLAVLVAVAAATILLLVPDYGTDGSHLAQAAQLSQASQVPTISDPGATRARPVAHAEARRDSATSAAGAAGSRHESVNRPEAAPSQGTQAGTAPDAAAKSASDTAPNAVAAADAIKPKTTPAMKPTVGFMIMSTPAGAEIFIDGESRGVTPLNVSFNAETARTVAVVLKKKKHKDYRTDIAIGPELAGKIVPLAGTLKRVRAAWTPRAGARGVKKAGGDPFEDL